MAIVIRRYEPSDLDAVINVFLRAIREVASRDYDAAQIDAWAQADRDVWARRRLDRPTWLALVDGAVAGFGDLQSDGHIDMLFVHPEHQRAGAANALLDQIESEARNQHLGIIDTDASLTARPFFEARGFGVVRSQVVEVRGARLMNFRMQKRLDPV
ncbi:MULTISPECIES: GNAT family N-acetyltransferase [Burkholderiaceae]|uniref:Acetyltransferase n=1 Tax=Caballeronia sordidicola TaxID=196367 RepID=A0A242N1H4_CABSO|nr:MULTISPECIES: GNAT family N-acetyltransferase [Burkholderiaceae]AME26501.1 acetyltransferase [Burkholderia sp. PAMC 26561]OTP77224.1 Acetyltransferase [Caballeronia sordidicola]